MPAAKVREACRILTEAESLFATVLQGVYQSMQATAAAVQRNNINLIRGMIGRPRHMRASQTSATSVTSWRSGRLGAR